MSGYHSPHIFTAKFLFSKTVGGLLVACRWPVGGLLVACRWSVGNVSVTCRPTDDRQLVEGGGGGGGGAVLHNYHDYFGFGFNQCYQLKTAQCNSETLIV